MTREEREGLLQYYRDGKQFMHDHIERTTPSVLIFTRHVASREMNIRIWYRLYEQVGRLERES